MAFATVDCSVFVFFFLFRRVGSHFFYNNTALIDYNKLNMMDLLYSISVFCFCFSSLNLIK